MLILIAGVTGNIGKYAAKYGLEQGHQIRGLGRSPDKLDPAIQDKLESFVVSKTYYDIPALEQATKGVDAVLCAYGGMPELHLDGQLLLYRATERAGVKVRCSILSHASAQPNQGCGVVLLDEAEGGLR